MIELLAVLLIVIRVIALCYIFNVIKMQLDLMRRPIDAEITEYRKKLYYFTLALAGSNFIPILFDLFIILRGVGVIFETLPTVPLLVIYTVSNTLASLLAAYLISRIYNNAVTVDQSHKKSEHTLMND